MYMHITRDKIYLFKEHQYCRCFVYFIFIGWLKFICPNRRYIKCYTNEIKDTCTVKIENRTKFTFKYQFFSKTIVRENLGLTSIVSIFAALFVRLSRPKQLVQFTSVLKCKFLNNETNEIKFWKKLLWFEAAVVSDCTTYCIVGLAIEEHKTLFNYWSDYVFKCFLENRNKIRHNNFLGTSFPVKVKTSVFGIIKR